MSVAIDANEQTHHLGIKHIVKNVVTTTTVRCIARLRIFPEQLAHLRPKFRLILLKGKLLQISLPACSGYQDADSCSAVKLFFMFKFFVTQTMTKHLLALIYNSFDFQMNVCHAQLHLQAQHSTRTRRAIRSFCTILYWLFAACARHL